MRLLRSAVALAVLLPFLAMVSPASAAVAAVAAPTSMMLVGDSITHGSAGDYTWRYRLWKHLTGSGVDVDLVGPSELLYDNVRSSGATIVESAAYADPAFDRAHDARSGRFVGTFAGYPTGARDLIRADVQTYQPRYIVVALGTNDLFWFSTRDPALVAQDMSAFVDNARLGRADVRIVLVAVPPTKAAQTDATLAARIGDYNQRLSVLATTRSTAASPIAYVPTPAGYQPDYGQATHDSYDGTHPNARGEIRIADAVGDVLSSRFGLGPAYPLALDGVPIGPVIPFALRCQPGNGTATLTWDESPGATGYWIQRRYLGETSWGDQLYQFSPTEQPFVNNWLYNGVTYEYRLQAAKMYDRGIASTCVVTPGA